MKKISQRILKPLLLTFLTGIAIANPTPQSKIHFSQPEKFIDFRTKIVLTEKDRNQLMDELAQQIQTAIAEILPNGQSMSIDFTNIDMAGYVYPSANDIRTVRQDSDKSLLVFDYSIYDAEGNQIDQGHKRLINQHLSSIEHRSKRYEHSHFKYEMAMFSRWLKRYVKR
jgi:hypothetical protein